MVVGYQIGEQGSNHRTWLKIVRTTDAQGKAILTTNRAIVELGRDSTTTARSDGFTVVTVNGTLYFLINEGDGSTAYDEFDTSGRKVSSWTYLSQHGFSNGYGVTTAPDGTLYFNAGQSILHFDSSGTFLSSQNVNICQSLEDIDVVVEP